jgi:hypothetical protein
VNVFAFKRGNPDPVVAVSLFETCNDPFRGSVISMDTIVRAAVDRQLSGFYFAHARPSRSSK